ncbi:hypothetical protein BASA81_003151 [Batrachochytrium salamandrivorans]|nr:hypothetical protein BASA81_003151 [Batrachochytrium salamandrivorans]
MSSTSTENLPPQTLSRIMREVGKLNLASKQQAVEGISFIFNEKDICDIQADIQGPPGTPYEGGVFRCRLVVGRDYPSAPPKGFFATKIFHPNVAVGSGEICVNTLKKDWQPELGLWNVLQSIRCLLIMPFPESGLNEEASRLCIESYDEYFKRASLFTRVHAPAVATTPVTTVTTEGGEPKLVKKPSTTKAALRRL